MTAKKRAVLPWLIAGGLLLAAAAAGLLLGSVRMGPARLWAALCGTDRTAAVILWQLRLPRVLAAALAGIGLSAAGFLLQTVTDNDLCAPNIIGVNAGAGLAVMLVLCLWPALWRWQPLFAFFGALLTTLAVLGVSAARGKQSRSATLVLAGVAVSALLNAGISFLSVRYPDALSSYAAFSVGGFSGVSLPQLATPAALTALCLMGALLLAPQLRLLCLGEEAAAGLGVNVRLLRLVSVILASALCAAIVSYAGLLGFVGLIVPHMARRVLAGQPLRRQIVFSSLCGGILVILSDLLGRILLPPGEIPAGVFMALLGAPFFLYLLLRRRCGDDRMS